MIDIIVLFLLLVMVFFFVLSDKAILLGLLGLDETTNWINFYLKLVLLGFVLLVSIYVFWFILGKMASRWERLGAFQKKFSTALSHFKEGLLSVRTVKQPILFVLLTIGIWFSYIMMTFLPFAMIQDSLLGSLGLKEALVITVISAVGVVIPSPGGIGTYHLLVQQGLYLFYQIPETTGFAYALISHASVMIIILLVTPLSLLVAAQRRSGTL